MSSENSPHSEVQEVPANGNDSDNYEFSRTATYEDLVQNPELFWDKLKQFLSHIDKTFKIPFMYGKSLDLHRLFTEVTTRGGLQKVIKDRRCKEVMDIFNFGANITNAAFVLRKFYQKLLFEFEHVYYFQEPLASFPAREEALKELGQKYENCDKGTIQPGVMVDGIIDGKFDNGYFVTVNIGSEELKGVLYQSAYKKRSSKSSEMESKRPKFQRSGYNFFVSDHYSRVKAEYVGQNPRLIMKEIGNMWSNLSESDRQIYQEKGLEDAERYNKEIEQYKSIMDTCEAETVAATDASTSANAKETETETETDTDTETEAEPETAAETETKTETEIAAKAEAETETEIAAKAEAETEAETETEIAPKAETETETETEAEAEAEAETETETEIAAKAETETVAEETETEAETAAEETEAEADP